MENTLHINDKKYLLKIFSIETHPQWLVDEKKQAIFDLFIQRDQTEFYFSPDKVVHYPEIDSKNSPFFTDPVSYVQACIDQESAEKQTLIDHVIILTTHGHILNQPFIDAGYRAEKIDMPAGPKYTYAFSKLFPDSNPQKYTNAGKTLYIEAVNEHDEKIRPTFSLVIKTENHELCGGVCGSIFEDQQRKYAYIATLVIKKGLEKSTGSALASATWDYLRRQGVSQINLGTQTAAKFYAKQGFSVIHRLVKNLKIRLTNQGKEISNDLVIMAKAL